MKVLLMISTTSVTEEFALLANFYKTSSESVFQELKESLKKE